MSGDHNLKPLELVLRREGYAEDGKERHRRNNQTQSEGEAKPNQEGRLGMLAGALPDRFQIVFIGTMHADMVIICVGAVVGGGRQRAEQQVRNTIRRRCVEVSAKTYEPAMVSF